MTNEKRKSAKRSTPGASIGQSLPGLRKRKLEASERTEGRREATARERRPEERVWRGWSRLPAREIGGARGGARGGWSRGRASSEASE